MSKLLWIVMTMTLLGFMCGCGAEAKSETPVNVPTEQIDKNTAEIEGNKNAIHTNSVKISNVETTINTKNNAFEKSFDAEIEKMSGDIENNNNSMWYILGGLIIFGVVWLATIFLILWFYRGFPWIGRHY